MNPALVVFLISAALVVTLVVVILRQAGTIGDLCAKLSNAESRLRCAESELSLSESLKRNWTEIAMANQIQAFELSNRLNHLKKSQAEAARAAGSGSAAYPPPLAAETYARSGKRRAKTPRGR